MRFISNDHTSKNERLLDEELTLEEIIDAEESHCKDNATSSIF